MTTPVKGVEAEGDPESAPNVLSPEEARLLTSFAFFAFEDLPHTDEESALVYRLSAWAEREETKP